MDFTSALNAKRALLPVLALSFSARVRRAVREFDLESSDGKSSGGSQDCLRIMNRTSRLGSRLIAQQFPEAGVIEQDVFDPTADFV